MEKMQALSEVWAFTRARLDQSLEGLSDEGWTWRMYPGAHSIAEIVLHIAGAEYYWWVRIMEVPEQQWEHRLERAVIEGFIREGGFSFSPEQCTKALAMEKLEMMRPRLDAMFAGMTDAQCKLPIISPVGDNVTGESGLVRLAQHAGYHTGQIWTIRMNPAIPA